MTTAGRIFDMLRAAIEGRRLDPQRWGEVEPKEWWQLFRLAQRGRVVALTAATLSEGAAPPREVLIPWMAESEKAMAWARHQAKAAEELKAMFDRNGIPCLLLKGLSLSRFYKEPLRRQYGDIDLYFYDHHREADAVAQREAGVEIEGPVHHHSRYEYRGITVESHLHLFNQGYPPSNRGFEKRILEVCPSATFEVLYFLRHEVIHYSASHLTLRDLCDWAFMVKAWRQEMDWEMVSRIVKEYGMEPFVRTLSGEVARRLGVEVGEWGEVGDDEAARFEQDVLGLGEGTDKGYDGWRRLGWKMRRYKAMYHKRRACFSDSEVSLLWGGVWTHISTPRSIFHKV